MMERLNGSHIDGEDKKALQINYYGLFQANNYSFGTKSKVGTANIDLSAFAIGLRHSF
jgi:hypothetical protein